MNHAFIKEWVRKYKLDGIEWFKNNKITKQYSSELKEIAIKYVLMNGFSKEVAIKKYENNGINGLEDRRGKNIKK